MIEITYTTCIIILVIAGHLFYKNCLKTNNYDVDFQNVYDRVCLRNDIKNQILPLIRSDGKVQNESFFT